MRFTFTEEAHGRSTQLVGQAEVPALAAASCSLEFEEGRKASRSPQTAANDRSISASGFQGVNDELQQPRWRMERAHSACASSRVGFLEAIRPPLHLRFQNCEDRTMNRMTHIGGAWFNSPRAARHRLRYGYAPGRRFNYLSFRLARREP